MRRRPGSVVDTGGTSETELTLAIAQRRVPGRRGRPAWHGPIESGEQPMRRACPVHEEAMVEAWFAEKGSMALLWLLWRLRCRGDDAVGVRLCGGGKQTLSPPGAVRAITSKGHQLARHQQTRRSPTGLSYSQVYQLRSLLTPLFDYSRLSLGVDRESQPCLNVLRWCMCAADSSPAKTAARQVGARSPRSPCSPSTHSLPC